MNGKLLFLGTGGSVGVPLIGCGCAVCSSSDPLNHRLRPSALIQIGRRKFLIDAGPDFRWQALKFGITHLDGLLLTHAHYDHTGGMDDLRPICFERGDPLPILLSHATAQDLQTRSSYLFRPGPSPKKKPSSFHLQILPDKEGTVEFEGLSVQYMTYTQSGMFVNGYRILDFAYLTDIRNFSPDIFEQLKGVKNLVVSALRFGHSDVHFSIDEAIDFITKVGAERAWLIHLSHELEYHHTNAYLPPHIRMAFDGLEINF